MGLNGLEEANPAIDGLPPPRQFHAATWALRAQFFVAGALFATWGVQVPNAKAHYALSEPALALAMMAAGVGSVAALLVAGPLLARHPPRGVVPVCGLVAAVAIGGLLLPSGYAGLLLLMLTYGIAAALFDVAINDEAATLERALGRPLMSGFHGVFSIGGMVGAAAGGLLARLGASPTQHLVGAALVLGLVALGAGLSMLRQDRRGGPAGAALSLPRGPLLVLGALAAAALVAEGAMYDWSVLYLRQELQASPGTAALAYASFSAAMAAGRFGGDWIRARVTPVSLLRWSGALGATGMVLALAVPQTAAVLAGFALVGLGFSNVVPVLFSAAANVPNVAAAHGIAAVASVGYVGMMAGPPLIGFIAHGRSLADGLLVVVLFAGLVTAFAGRVSKPGTHRLRR